MVNVNIRMGTLSVNSHEYSRFFFEYFMAKLTMLSLKHQTKGEKCWWIFYSEKVGDHDWFPGRENHRSYQAK